MSNERDLSDLKISRQECEHCGAVWINGQHRWNTGCTSPSSELDLAGLVCNTSYGDPSKCINPQRGEQGGDTWEKRSAELEKLIEENEGKEE